MASGGNSMAQLRTAYAALGPAGVFAVVAGSVCAVIVGVSFWSFGRSVVVATVPAAAGASDKKDSASSHDAAFDKYLAQINGRTMLIMPGAPNPPPPPPPPPEPTQVKDDGPTSYGGSDIIAMVLDTVWFSDGKKLSVGDAAKDETEVVQVSAPWEAVLRWKGKEFTVPLFARDKVVLKPEEKPSEKSPGDAKQEEQTASTAPEVGPPVPDDLRSEADKIAASKTPPPEPKPAEPKSDAAPDATPAAVPPGETGPDSNDNPPPGGDGALQ